MKQEHAGYIRFLRMLKIAKLLNLHDNAYCRFRYSEISQIIKF